MAYHSFTADDGSEYGSFETFYVDAREARENRKREGEDSDVPTRAGWYWWTCFPGCMPDSSAFGPFRSERAAVRDARENA